MNNLKNIIYDHCGLFSVCYYLHIEGSTGHGNKGFGGTYNFVGGYFNPDELVGRDNVSLDIWCESNNLKYVTADNFPELVLKLSTFNPLKN